MRQTNVIDRTSDEIEVWLAASEQVISRIRTEQMALLREAARRQLPLADGCRSLAEWAAGRMDMSTPAARTLSSTAQRLAGLPLIEEAAAAGNLSYERTVEVARLATADAQGETLDEVRHLDIGGLRRRAAQRRRLTRSDERAIAEAEHVVLRPNLDESRWDIWGTVAGYHGRVIDKALTVRGDRLPTPPEGMRVSLGKRKADALVSVCQDSLDGTGPAGGPSPPLVTVFVDAAEASREGGETSAFIEAGPRVGPDTLARVLCAGSVELLARTEDGTPLAIGEAARHIPPKLRRFVLARDGACTADACDSLYRLQPHHRVPWAQGGPTTPENLTTLCWWHHHVVIHQFGYRIDPDTPRGRLRFLAPSQPNALANCPSQPP